MMDAKLAMVVVSSGLATLGSATVCMAHVGVDPLGIGSPAAAIAAAPASTADGLGNDPATTTIVVQSTLASPDTSTAPVGSEGVGTADAGATADALAAGSADTTLPAVNGGNSSATQATTPRTTVRPTTVRPTTTTVRPTTTTVRPTTTTTVRPPTVVSTTAAPTTVAPTTTVRITPTTIAAATRYSVSGVPVPSSFSVPSSWRGPVPDWPAGCRNGQLEDNGRWNCQ